MVVSKGSSKVYKKKVMRKPRKNYKRSGMGTKRLISLIKKVSLTKAETKEVHNIQENHQLNHNVENLHYSFLYTQQGIGDGDTGLTNYNCRVGNEIVAKGMSFKFWIATKYDRPNVMFRLIIFKYRSDTTIGSAYKSQGTSNYMLRDIDTDKITILKTMLFSINNSQIAYTGPQVDWKGKEAHLYKKVWIPLKNKKIQYKEDNSGSTKYTDVGFSLVAYDSYGTTTIDNIASYAFNYKLYFKDP